MANKKSNPKVKLIVKESDSIGLRAEANKSTLLVGLVLAFLSILLYANTFGHGFTVDDPLVISKNKIVQKGIKGVNEIWTSSYLEGFNGEVDAAYRPISLSLFAIEKTIFDGSVTAMHIMHVFYFSIGVLLCYLFSFKLFLGNKKIAIITTLLFIVHPIHTEVVNNLKSRDELLMFLGLMGTGLYYLKYLERENISTLMVSLIFFLLALFSKESAISFFLIIPLLYLWYNQKWNKQVLQHSSFYLSLCFIYLFIRTSIVGSYSVEMDYMNNALLAEGSSFIERFPNAMVLMGKYIIMLFMPYPLSVDYSYNSIPMLGWSSIWPYLSITVFMGFIYLAYDGIRKKKIYGVLIPWYLITMVVASNIFILIGSTFAERFLFVPSFAFCAALAHYFNYYFGSKSLIIASGLSLIVGGWTFVRNQDWKSDLDLFTRDVKYQQNNARVQTFFGRFTYHAAKDLADNTQAKQFEIAKNALQKAIVIAPDYITSHYYLGLLAKDLKNSDLAIRSFSEVVKLDDNFKDGRLEYAVALRKNKEYKSALKQYFWLINNGRDDVTNYNNTGFCYFQMKDYENAIKYYIKAHELDPANKKALSSIVAIYGGSLNQPSEAKIYRDRLKALR